jgi:transcriptional regulator with PAS, ATPase and Fis domain
VIPIKIPSLRERREDILPLAIAYVDRMSRRLERDFVLAEPAIDALLRYHFPGNVRELQNMIERACYLADGQVLTPEHLMVSPGDSQSATVGAAQGVSRLNTPQGPLRDRVHAYERMIIEDAISKAGSLRAAAKQLGVSHATLVQKRKQWQSGS